MQTAIVVRLDIEIKERLKKLADARDKTPHKMMQIAVKEYVEREESREIFKQEAIASYQHYKETGLHVNGDEVIEWLNSWGSDKVLTAPTPHK